jgi:hypothetical protein
MRRTVAASAWLGALALTFAITSGCDLFSNKDSPSTPTPTGSLDPFVGTFTSASSGTPSPTSCRNVTYVVTPTSSTTATISFTATCASNVAVSGTGTGTLSGTTLNWNAQGTVSQGGLTCPFTFPTGTGNTAVPDAAGAIKVNYSGTVCGIPVSGSEVLKK